MTSARVGQATLRSSARTWRTYSAAPMRSFGAAGPRAGLGLAAGGSAVGADLALTLHHPLHLSVHGYLFGRESLDERAGQEGLEPPTAGFGDRCSTS